MRPEGPRDDFAGPDTGPEAPFPIRMSGPVIKGFGRGSKEVRQFHIYLHLLLRTYLVCLYPAVSLFIPLHSSVYLDAQERDR